jgi:hypothetical protein
MKEDYTDLAKKLLITEQKFKEANEQLFLVYSRINRHKSKQEQYFAHLEEFEAWINEFSLKNAKMQLANFENMQKGDSSLLEKSKISQTYHDNMVKAYRYTSEIFSVLLYYEKKSASYEAQILELSDKIRQLENEVNRLNSLNNF